MIKLILKIENRNMKARLKKTVIAIAGICLLIHGECFAVQTYTQLPFELDLKIMSYLPAIDLLSLAQENQAWRARMRTFVMSESELLDLSALELNQNQFKKIFQEGGALHLAKNIGLSHLNYKGDWIGLLPTENLAPRENGAASLKVKTKTGAIFSYLGQNSELGHEWRDPNLLIWSSPARDGLGQILRMSHEDAIQYCSDRGASLPSSEEWTVLSQFFGRNEEATDQSSQYAPQVLSDLNIWYWALPNTGDDPAKAPVFNGLNGGVFNTDRTHHKAVRCVLRASQ